MMNRRSAIFSGLSGILVAIRSVTAQQSSDARPLIPAPYLQPPFLASPDAPFSIVIPAKDEPGERLIVTGRVLDGTRAVAGASIYVVQADVSGRYSKDYPDSDVTFYKDGSVSIKARLCGFMRSDANGQYRFETVRPGHYPPETNPSHVHYVVRAMGYKSRMMDLRFQDDPVIAARRKEGIPDDDGFEPGKMVVRPVTRDNNGVWHVTRDLEMIRE
jgi:protocatechuate 3,4-dioxygenase beta subunit